MQTSVFRFVIRLQAGQLTARQLVLDAVRLGPDRLRRGVVDRVAGGRPLQPGGGFHVVHDLDVGGVPDVLPAAQTGAERLQRGPVLLCGQLIAVAPDVHHVQVLRLVQRREPLAVLRKAVLEVAGGGPCHPVPRHAEVVAVPHHPGVPDAEGRQQSRDLRRPAAVGVGQPPHRVAHRPLQGDAVLQHLPGHLLQRAAGDGRVQTGVAGHLVAGVEVLPLGGGDPLFLPDAAVEVEGAPDAVPVEQFHQPPVLQPAVVKAHGQHLVPAPGEAGVDVLQFRSLHGHCLLCQSKDTTLAARCKPPPALRPIDSAPPLW